VKQRQTGRQSGCQYPTLAHRDSSPHGACSTGDTHTSSQWVQWQGPGPWREGGGGRGRAVGRHLRVHSTKSHRVDDVVTARRRGGPSHSAATAAQHSAGMRARGTNHCVLQQQHGFGRRCAVLMRGWPGGIGCPLSDTRSAPRTFFIFQRHGTALFLTKGSRCTDRALPDGVEWSRQPSTTQLSHWLDGALSSFDRDGRLDCFCIRAGGRLLLRIRHREGLPVRFFIQSCKPH
jgi:hypothetical protein